MYKIMLFSTLAAVNTAAESIPASISSEFLHILPTVTPDQYGSYFVHNPAAASTFAKEFSSFIEANPTVFPSIFASGLPGIFGTYSDTSITLASYTPITSSSNMPTTLPTAQATTTSESTSRTTTSKAVISSVTSAIKSITPTKTTSSNIAAIQTPYALVGAVVAGFAGFVAAL